MIFRCAFLKLSKYLPAPLLSNIINECINDGVFPDKPKIAKVVSIFQSGDKEIPINYRPISVLTYLLKIFEKVLYTRLNDYFIKNNLLSQQQYGFHNNHSTSDLMSRFRSNEPIRRQHLYRLDPKSTKSTIIQMQKTLQTICRAC